MQIKIGMDGDIVILDLIGDLVASTAEDFKAQTGKLTEKNFTYILVEMSKLNFMDSSGLGACIAVHKLVAEKKGMLIFAQPSDSVSKIFRITRADQKLNIAATRSAALKSIQEKIMMEKKQG